MNALLINPKSPETFWKLSTLCGLSGKKALLPPLGLITVAALLPRDWNLRLVDQEVQDLTEEDWAFSDIALVSGMIIQREAIHETISQAGQRGVPVVVGGPYASIMPEKVLARGCDFLVQGEGEHAVPALVRALEAGRTKGVFSGQRPGMSESPLPRIDLVRMQDYVTMPLQITRGCPYDCEFCNVSALYGRRLRTKDPDQVLAELEALYRAGWRSEVFICDDNFIGNRKKAKVLLAAMYDWLKQRDMPFNFWTQASLDLGQDQELMDLMTRANFAHVFIGVESSEPEVLEAANKHQNTARPLAESINTITKNGLTVMASFILGLDRESPGAGERIVSLVNRTNVPLVMVNILHAAPSTRLWERLKKEGRLIEEKTQGDSHVGGMNLVPQRPAEDIYNEHMQAWDRLYDSAAFLERLRRYYQTMRPTRRALGREDQGPVKRPRAPLGQTLSNLRSLILLCWALGVRDRNRALFWKCLLAIRRDNPSRIIRFLADCGTCYSIMTYKNTRLRGLHKRLMAEQDVDRPAATEAEHA
ncbi:MAG: radical SAM protein [Desulfovibrionaceae bacterium]|nr:radical SAM protein [Desulfovibrionaceae bacterium]